MDAPTCDFCRGPIFDLADGIIEVLKVEGKVWSIGDRPPLCLMHANCSYGEVEGPWDVSRWPKDLSVVSESLSLDHLFHEGIDRDVSFYTIVNDNPSLAPLVRRLMGDCWRIVACMSRQRRQESETKVEREVEDQARREKIQKIRLTKRP